ncbi:hypothetical protein N7481_004269 [Penicillium waksmanii]|uniref:uncharacterized protein n=1 Tax=Penicillium waksmanii TaxID=69791 RepID=UPI002548994A|nr:uncharacterized protein N7481_004269 [Penicillium waksmanii]KAJ5989059.1 hypothetical protein N7481_004269 [Penicillium waksmanii]
MCDLPFFPIFPICFQCGTDQNPCHCKVVGPTLEFLQVICWPASIFCGCGCTQTGREYVDSLPSLLRVGNDEANGSSVLGYPVKLNGQVSNAIPF